MFREWLNGMLPDPPQQISLQETFSVAAYQQLAYQTIRSTHQKGKLPILVGGTALYLNAVTQGLNIPKVPPNKYLRNKLERTPLGELLKKLEEIDPKTFARIDKQNPRRIIRALEVYYSIGQPLSMLTKKFIKRLHGKIA